MLDRVNNSSLAAKEALKFALERQRMSEERAEIKALASEMAGAGLDSSQKSGSQSQDVKSFGARMAEGLGGVNREIQKADSLAEDLVSGKVENFHEVAASIKRADLSFKFALEIRNRLVESYREVMRMNV